MSYVTFTLTRKQVAAVIAAGLVFAVGMSGGGYLGAYQAANTTSTVNAIRAAQLTGQQNQRNLANQAAVETNILAAINAATGPGAQARSASSLEHAIACVEARIDTDVLKMPFPAGCPPPPP